MGASLSCNFRLHHTPSCLGPTWRGLRFPAPHPTHDVDGPGCCQVNLEEVPQRAQSPTTTSYSLQGLQSPSAQTPPHHAPSFPSCPLKSTLLTAARASLQNRNKSLFCLHPPMASVCTWNEVLTPTSPRTSEAHPPFTVTQATSHVSWALNKTMSSCSHLRAFAALSFWNVTPPAPLSPCVLVADSAIEISARATCHLPREAFPDHQMQMHRPLPSLTLPISALSCFSVFVCFYF